MITYYFQERGGESGLFSFEYNIKSLPLHGPGITLLLGKLRFYLGWIKCKKSKKKRLGKKNLPIQNSNCNDDSFRQTSSNLNPKNCGGGRILPGAQEIACHFSQDHTMVTKFLDFIKKHPKYKVVKSFFYYLDRCSRNSAETEPRS